MTTPILKQIAELPALPQGRLKALWQEYFGVAPPAYRKGFLVRGLAHRIRELTYGGLSPVHQARLEALIAEEETPRQGRGRRRSKEWSGSDRLLVGTLPVREWKGVMHEVTVIGGGFESQGRRFRSLSAVARTIAGTRWNGWLFFAIPNPNKRGRGK
jgi:hypothetical protein